MAPSAASSSFELREAEGAFRRIEDWLRKQRARPRPSEGARADPERNDLARPCDAGSVRWPELMATHELAGESWTKARPLLDALASNGAALGGSRSRA